MRKAFLHNQAKRWLLPVLFFILLTFTFTAQATHLKAGNIFYKSDTTAARSPYKFYITLVTFSVAATYEDMEATLYFGDCTHQTVTRESRTLLNNSYMNVYRFEHTYTAAGTYTVTYVGSNRNGGVLNISNAFQQTFFLQSTLTVDPLLGPNKSPVLQYAPLDAAVRNQVFQHNPFAYDADGDSLSFKIVPLKTESSLSACGDPTGKIAAGYQGLENFLGPVNTVKPAGFSIDKYTGLLTWNTPGVVGEVNVAFVVEEWRNGRLLGQVTRDMQIMILEDSNRPPVLTIPKDVCLVAGASVQETITAQDPDGHAVSLSALAGILTPSSSGATFIPGTTSGAFTWQTSCQDIKAEPYQVLFTAEDQPTTGVRLKDLQPWRITVVGPPPVLRSAVQESSTRIRLTWDTYSCANARRIYIYRKEGPSSSFTPNACQPGVPSSAGYTLVGQVNADVTTFLDTYSGTGNPNFCYRIYADFGGTAGGNSVASNEVCATLVTGMREGLGQQFSFYPNPATTDFTVQAPASVRLMKAQVLNQAGLKISTLTPRRTAAGWVFDLRSLTAGFYLLHLQTDQGTLVQKLVIAQ
ncbi:T9SS C-terminal target domain-containing protein [Rufibacter immobilis]|uniref:T9SS C-terminal target domain-containing protein n=1 Tax=Rufibacter immobilis TaxID=1348778 RepID=A0A3M9N581_9BACT|nr:T9SS type A sorting domain-containing protein [Rufibacter immobilis]RNI32909.1 T9SS C-terminal target domain-containing protein [Rufibacter immobilis]